MTLSRRCTAFLFLVSLMAPLAARAQSTPQITWQGEVRPRFQSRSPVEGSWDHLTSMRTRLGMSARMDGGLRLFIQVQDVRDWGGEASERDRSADAVDFHQAFLEVDRIPVVGGLIRAGRQEVALAEQRFMAAPDWGQAGQAFDGTRWIRPVGKHRLELVYLMVQEGSSPAHDRDADFLAGWYALDMEEAGNLDLLAIHDREGGEDGNRQYTLGAVWRMEKGAASFRIQNMHQLGRRGATDVRASMLTARAGLTLLEGKGDVTLWYDQLSGDSDSEDDRIEVFSTLFGARNRYYGRADYFTDIPSHTGGLGLRDMALKLAYRPTRLLSLNLDIHAFRTCEKGDLSSRRLAEEADIWGQLLFREHLTLQAGYSLTRGGPAMEELGRLDGTGNFGYLMTSLRF